MPLLVFDLQRFSLNDGPGIRTTVFLQGCPLACFWCHNPESQSLSPVLLHYDARCLRCGACARVCPTGCIAVDAASWSIDRSRCTLCGRCAEACPVESVVLSGRIWEDDALLDRLLPDLPFYRESGGGVTFSGGEPLLQAAGLARFLPRLKEQGIHAAIETAGAVPASELDLVLPHADLFLFDLKHVDPAAHRAATGADNRRILENLARVAASGTPVVVRVPVIPGFNDSEQALVAIADRAAGLGIGRIDLLPYHRLGSSKYAALGREDVARDLVPPSAGRLEALRRTMERPGLSVRIEGAPAPADDPRRDASPPASR